MGLVSPNCFCLISGEDICCYNYAILDWQNKNVCFSLQIQLLPCPCPTLHTISLSQPAAKPLEFGLMFCTVCVYRGRHTVRRGAVQANSMEEFLWSEDRNWLVEDIKRVPSESVDWLYDRDTHGNQAVAKVQRVTLADTTAPSYCSGKLKYQQLR